VEVAAHAIDAWLEPGSRSAIHVALRNAGFDRVAIDARGFRSGSLNVLGGVVAEPMVRARSSVVGDAATFALELAHRGVACDVEARERLAVVRCADEASFAKLTQSGARIAVADTARAHGFTHVAIDLAGSDESGQPNEHGEDAAIRRA
jgi:PP-loop superfamily ATP-utilizing enzyme